MSRIRINIPESFPFTTQIPVRITDLNYGNHVGNDSLLSILHEARMQFLAHYGYTEMQFAGVAMIMSDVGIEFRNELFYGNTVIASVAALDFTRVGFDLYYKMETKKNENNILVATAKSGMICYDYEKKKIVAVPEEAKRRLCES